MNSPFLRSFENQEDLLLSGFTGHAGADIWQGAQREGRLLITRDLDFSDIRNFQPGAHHGIVLIRLQSPSRRNLIARVTELFAAEDITGWAGCFVVVTERKRAFAKSISLET